MLAQDLQPYMHHNYRVFNNNETWNSFFEYSAAFEGGSSLCFSVNPTGCQESAIFDIFSFSPPLSGGECKNLQLEYSTRTSGLSLSLVIEADETLFVVYIESNIARHMITRSVSELLGSNKPISFAIASNHSTNGWNSLSCDLPASTVHYIGVLCSYNASQLQEAKETHVNSLLGNILLFNPLVECYDDLEVKLLEDNENIKLFFHNHCRHVDAFLTSSHAFLGRSYSDRLTIGRACIPPTETSLTLVTKSKQGNNITQQLSLE